ncbi:hypothetical protein, partial [Bittarella massiliensis (ex Durand et al. 2017)]
DQNHVGTGRHLQVGGRQGRSLHPGQRQGLVYLAQIVIPYWVVSCLNGFRLKKGLPRGPVKGRILVPCTFILLAIGIVGIASLLLDRPKRDSHFSW